MVTTYTAADDSRLEQLQRFARYYRTFNPDGLIKLIPFNKNIGEISKECKKWDIKIIQPNSVIDQCGQSIFKDNEYRPGIKAWRYMRKLNCFTDSDTPFIFMDINNLPLHNAYVYEKLLDVSKKDILFSGFSAPKRSIKNREIYELLDNSIGPGYNCSLIASKGKVLYERDFQLLSNPNLRKFFGKAPEQGYLALLLSLSNISHDIMKMYVEKMNFSIGRSKTLNSGQLAMDNDLTIRTTRNKLLLTYKTTGANLIDMPSQISDVIDKNAEKWLTDKS